MAILYVDRKGSELRSTPEVLSVYEDRVLQKTIPLRLLERVVLRSEIALSSSVLGHLAQAGVGTLILSGRQGKNVAHVLGRSHNDARIRLAQYRLFYDEELRCAWSRRLVIAKLRHQIFFLVKALEEQKERGPSLLPAIDSLRDLLRQSRSESGIDRPTLQGIEGRAGRLYFSAYFSLFPPSLQAKERTRRPPRDPVNACLSLGYTILHFECVRILYQCGLDPMVGFYHELSYGRESLACDLIEPFRPVVDRWVWTMFRTRLLRDDHFVVDKGACLLGKAGRGHFYANYESNGRALRKNLLREGRLMAKAYLLNVPEIPLEDLEGETDEDSLS